MTKAKTVHQELMVGSIKLIYSSSFCIENLLVEFKEIKAKRETMVVNFFSVLFYLDKKVSILI